MAAANQTITQVRELIVAGQYQAARKLLKTSSHPRTDEWLAKLDELEREKTQPLKKNRRDLQEMSPVTAKPAAAPARKSTPLPAPKMNTLAARTMTAADEKTRPSRTQTAAKAPARLAEAKFQEKPLYKDATFTITRQELMIHDAIFPLRQITSVQLHETAQADDTGQVIFKGVAGLAVCIVIILIFHNRPIFNMMAVVGAAGIFSSIGWLIWKLLSTQTPHTYALRLNFDLVEEDVFVTQKKDEVTEIAHQINRILSENTQPSRTAQR